MGAGEQKQTLSGDELRVGQLNRLQNQGQRGWMLAQVVSDLLLQCLNAPLVKTER